MCDYSVLSDQSVARAEKQICARVKKNSGIAWNAQFHGLRCPNRSVYFLRVRPLRVLADFRYLAALPQYRSSVRDFADGLQPEHLLLAEPEAWRCILPPPCFPALNADSSRPHLGAILSSWSGSPSARKNLTPEQRQAIGALFGRTLADDDSPDDPSRCRRFPRSRGFQISLALPLGGNLKRMAEASTAGAGRESRSGGTR